MPVSHYFNNYASNQTNEMRLMEDVIVESIEIMGHDIYYLPRDSWSSDDTILGENVASKFSRAYVIEAYLANVEGYEGDGDFFSKFGLEIRDTSNFVVSRRSFERYVPSDYALRPKEGDLIFVPVMQKIFEIKFVEEELMFYSIGKRTPYIYELRCELFRYSNENIDTGIDEVDHVEHTLSYTIKLNVNQGNGNNFYAGEVVYQGISANSSNSVAVGEVKEWQPLSNSILLMNIKGDFSANTLLVGTVSNSRYNIVSVDSMGDHVEYDLYDNKQLQDEANTFIDISEVNPFGNP